VNAYKREQGKDFHFRVKNLYHERRVTEDLQIYSELLKDFILNELNKGEKMKKNSLRYPLFVCCFLFAHRKSTL